MDTVTLIIGAWLLNGFIGCVVGHCRGTGAGMGLFLGIMLGPVGWILMMFDGGPKLGIILVFLLFIAGAFAITKIIKEERETKAAESARQAAETKARIAREAEDRKIEREQWREVAPAAAPAPATSTPRPYVIYHPPHTPTPQETAAEIARKYGASK